MLGEISFGCWGGLSRLDLRIAVDCLCSWWLAFHWDGFSVGRICCRVVTDVVGIGWVIDGGGLPCVESNRFGFG